MSSINKKAPIVAQLKTAVSAPSVKRPAAPPVYRPQPLPKVLQRKSSPSSSSDVSQSRKRPVAPRIGPPVYRPQPVPRVLQTKKSTIAPAQAGFRPKPNQLRVIQPMLGSIVSAVSSFFSPAPVPVPPAPPPPRPIDTLSELPEHLRTRGKQEILDYVFRRFCDFGWEYDVSQDFGSPIIGSLDNYYPEDIQANCKALANAFGQVLLRLGIDAELATVRAPVPRRRFVVKLKRFVDPQVTGNVKDQYGNVMRGYYLFREHYAVWVPLARKYYDPMAKATYTDIKPFIAFELVALDGDENEFVSSDGRYLFHRGEGNAPGGFFFYQMEEIRRDHRKRYAQTLKSAGFTPKKKGN